MGVNMIVNNMPAYTISNEDQRWATNVVPGVKSVLTVAGSGDQALFYKLAGARTIDTFDITCNARVIQDIKYAAIKHLNREDYIDLITRLHRADGIAIEFLACALWKYLPEDTRKIIERSKHSMVFGCGLSASEYPENIPTESEYAELKKKLKKPFNFIWSDLDSLSAQLTKKYDLINISNIFDYCRNSHEQIQILRGLSQHLKTNGHVVSLPQIQRCTYKEFNLPNISYERTESGNGLAKMVLFQKTR